MLNPSFLFSKEYKIAEKNNAIINKKIVSFIFCIKNQLAVSYNSILIYKINFSKKILHNLKRGTREAASFFHLNFNLRNSGSVLLPRDLACIDHDLNKLEILLKEFDPEFLKEH